MREQRKCACIFGISLAAIGAYMEVNGVSTSAWLWFGVIFCAVVAVD